MNRRAVALVIAASTLLSACGGGAADSPAAESTPDSAFSGSPSTSPSAEDTPPPAYAVLSEAGLEATLLTIQDMPAGFAQDPPSGVSNAKTFCDYEPPFLPKVSVGRDFTKGEGLSAEGLHVVLRQYASADQARESFDAMVKALGTCRREVYQGTTLEYSLMAAPKIGDESIGVRITYDGAVLLQNFVLVGPTVVATGGGGPTQANADEIAHLLEVQVRNYQAAATK